MALLKYKTVLFTVRTVTCRTCGCLQQVQHSLKTYLHDTRFPDSHAPKNQSLLKLAKYSTCCGRTERYLSAVASSIYRKEQQRPLSRFDFLDMEDIEEIITKAEKSRYFRRFILNPELANLIVECLDGDLSENNALIFECNPGPGVLTRALLNGGAQRVVALESDKQFLPALQSLERRLHGQLEVVHCDFFKLDPIGRGSVRPPAMLSEKLFNDLGIAPAAWTEDIPIRVIGILPQKNERNVLWKHIYALFERISVFQLGRIEMNVLMSEKEYTKLTAEAGNLKHYQALSALYQVACEIQLLHKEPWSSFATNSKNGGCAIPRSSLTNDHLCLVRLTPRKDLFNQTFTAANSSTLVLMLKQCLTKRKAKLIDRLESWCPGSGVKLLTQVGLSEDILTGEVRPEEYKELFEAMEHSQDFSQSWLYDEVLENISSTLSHI
ncbi:dimethyladenosine transferase 2, mitochondrial [Rhincodon typus]|uniref:dimethyladenosine transferase 2, mitochondrial n=1 Tax=Rhincodon typus TaxID=259920 RepID=UPI0009A265A5|nr:dimethyladenosine transferase 2, mitochondrial [Rhincodon typus]XP_020389202.1 dimethyladenosine transferase 2, mitochondrial [Rhincodon typus]XP_048456728.1 dimethyladenosine transferase 2, mitochondrial [Rhincodon typus]XP_048456729.1 dimethyladenosine transferase 2, mitochondrial [Rhincodon typus]